VKDPARRTRYQDDQEYNSLFKQYEKHLLHGSENALNIRSALEETERTAHQFRKLYQVQGGGGRSHL